MFVRQRCAAGPLWQEITRTSEQKLQRIFDAITWVTELTPIPFGRTIESSRSLRSPLGLRRSSSHYWWGVKFEKDSTYIFRCVAPPFSNCHLNRVPPETAWAFSELSRRTSPTSLLLVQEMHARAVPWRCPWRRSSPPASAVWKVIPSEVWQQTTHLGVAETVRRIREEEISYREQKQKISCPTRACGVTLHSHTVRSKDEVVRWTETFSLELWLRTDRNQHSLLLNSWKRNLRLAV